MNRNALVQAALQKQGGGGSTGAMVQAMQNLIASFNKAATQFVKQSSQAEQQRAQAVQQTMAQIADTAERAVNKAEQRREIRRQEARQDRLTQEGREYQLQLDDYRQHMQQQLQKDAADIQLLLQENESKKMRLLDEHERGAATIAESVEAARDWVADMDARNGWDRLGPNGSELRKQLLGLARMAEVTRENLIDSPYASKLHAMIADANRAVVAGDESYIDVEGVYKPPMLQIPKEMIEAANLELPILSEQEAREWENRNGYPKGGVWAMETTDPKYALVNPVSFKALTKARMDDMMLAFVQSEEARRQAQLKLAEKTFLMDQFSEPLEEMQKEFSDAATIFVPDAFAAAIRPGLSQDGSGPPTAPEEVIRTVYARAAQGAALQPGVADKALRMALPKDDPNRWLPQAPMGPEGQLDQEHAGDFYDLVQIEAMARAAQKTLEEGFEDPTFRGNVGAWLGNLSEPQLWEAGLDGNTAAAIARANLTGTPAPPGVLNDAVSQVISKWSKLNRQNVLTPARANSPMNAWREANHAAAVLQDGHAHSVLSVLKPEELSSMVASGQISAETAESVRTNQNRLYRAPIGVLNGILRIHNRPGSRQTLHQYAAGGPAPEMERIEHNPKYAETRAYFESVAKTGIKAPWTAASEPKAIEVPGQQPSVRERPQPYKELANTILESRHKALSLQTAMGRPEEMGGAGIRAPGAQNVAHRSPQMGSQPPQSPPSAQPPPGQMAQPQQPRTQLPPGPEAPQLGPQPSPAPSAPSPPSPSAPTPTPGLGG